MLKFENTNVMNFDGALRGMRNPLNSWDKADSYWTYIEDPDTLQTAEFEFFAGENDLDLAKRLCNAGSADHRKFLRQIMVCVDITAPLYWVAEHDTYKVSTVRNSCSFMHKGVSKPFEINDFTVQDERVYYLLNPIEKEIYPLTYPYETDEFKIFTTENGREYKVYRNGRIVACEFSYTDCYGSGRTRTFKEKECKPSPNKNGYYEVHLGGGHGENWLVHRLVATVFLDNPGNLDTVNHSNGNKGDNSVENLEWCSRSENIKKGFDDGLFEPNKLHLAYNSWKKGHVVVPPHIKMMITNEHANGVERKQLMDKYDLSQSTLNNILYVQPCENHELFTEAYHWEMIIDYLNKLRAWYLETKDENVFKTIRQLLPQGYNTLYTWTANYEVLRNIYHSRKNHRLNEWHDFCHWIESLPYAQELIIGEETTTEEA